MKKYVMTIIPALALMVSCKDHPGHAGPEGNDGTNVVSTKIAAYSGGAGQLPGEDNLVSVEAYHFDGGKLVKTYSDFTGSGSNVFEINLDSRSGTLYLVALGDDGPEYARPQAEESEDAWLKRASAVSEDGRPGHFYTGKTSLAGTGMLQVELERGVARFDLKIDVAGEAEVRRIVFHDMLYGAPLFAGAGTDLSGIPSGDMEVDFGTPVSENRKGVAYIYGQDNASLTVSVDAVVDGKECTLAADLPDEIARNTVYTLTLRKDYITADLELSVSDWNDGGEIEISPDKTVLSVDRESGSIPSDVLVSQDARTLTLPYGATEFVLAIEGTGTADFSKVNLFQVRKGLFAPGVPAEDVVLNFHRKGLEHSYPDDAIILKLSSNPTRLSGGMDFDNPWYTHDFRRYVENELGVFTLPAEKEIFALFEDGEDPWMKIERDPAGDGSYRVLGGWRPNDPTADGRRRKGGIYCRTPQLRPAGDLASRRLVVQIQRYRGFPLFRPPDTFIR